MDDFDYESLPSTYSVEQHMLAGALAGMAEHAMIYPIDTIKARRAFHRC